MPDIRALLRRDLPASVVVFLIAIPLSLGIAAASGAPLLSGLVAAVVGGIVAGLLSGAPLQVSGPAAGLTVIVAGMVADFGWAATAAVVAMAGLVQIGLGLSRLGRAALALSPAVVHGMLAGIGIVIALGQIHVVLGGAAQSHALANLRDLPGQIAGHHDASVLIGAVTVLIMLFWPRLVKISLLPAALIAVTVATLLATLGGFAVERVDLPDAPLAELTTPRWPDAGPYAIGIAVLTIALVASVESLLSAVAVDKLHDGPRANLNKELIAQGVANTVSGGLGGLPVTGVIVRSSTNVAAGARTRASAVLHGVWIALFVLLFAGLLERIPLSALAAVLIVVGLKLVNLGQIKAYVRHRELPTYLVTALGVIVTDLLTGVALGMVTAVLLLLWRLARCEIRRNEVRPGDWLVNINGTLAFVQSARLARELGTLPPGRRVEVELHLDYLDHGAFETIKDWTEAYERGGGRVSVREIHDSWFHRATAGRLGGGKRQPRFLGSWAQWQAYQRGGADAMAAGISEFERSVAPLVRPHLADLARDGQTPQQLFITCADSRLVPNLITGSGPGDLFTLRNVGNIVPPHGSGDASVGAGVEYAVDVLKIRTITVCGHSGCGAVRAMMAGADGGDSSLARWLGHAVTTMDDTDSEERCCTANVLQQLANLRTYPSVQEALAADRLTLVGMYFDIAQTRMYTVDPDRGLRRPVGADT